MQQLSAGVTVASVVATGGVTARWTFNTVPTSVTDVNGLEIPAAAGVDLFNWTPGNNFIDVDYVGAVNPTMAWSVTPGANVISWTGGISLGASAGTVS